MSEKTQPTESNPAPPRIIVTGWRNWDNEEQIEIQLAAARKQYGDHTILVQGECPVGGADYIAKTIWQNWGLQVESHPADFKTEGRKAGPLRNQKMVDLGANLCLAFLHPNSKGTKDCLKRAQKANIPTLIINYNESTPHQLNHEDEEITLF